MHAGVRERVHLFHHQRRYVVSNPFSVSLPSHQVKGGEELAKISLLEDSKRSIEEKAANKVAASEKCHQEKRKTVNGEDILFAMTSLGFENYAEALKIYLAKYRDVSFARFRPRTRLTNPSLSPELATGRTLNMPWVHHR